MHESNRQHIYLQKPGASLSLEQEHAVCNMPDAQPVSIPLSYIKGIIVESHCQITTPLLNHCLQNNIPVTLITSNGQISGRFEPATMERIQLKKAQYCLDEHPELKLSIVRSIIRDKITAQLRLLNECHAQKKTTCLLQLLDAMKRHLAELESDATLEQIRGREGIAAAS